MIKAIFWTAAASFAYAYLLFPLLVFVRAAIRPRPHRKGAIEPAVSIVVAAHNEAGQIGHKVANLARLDYPADRLQIIIVSDGSDDGTAAIASARDLPNLTVLDLPRVGKGQALRAGVDAARGEILIFSDANSMFAPDAVRMLVRSFVDPQVGGVAGNQVYAPGGDGVATTRGERSYWDFDRALKIAQSRAGSIVSATGALYAIRRELFRPIPTGVTDDFYLSLAVVDAGRRLVFDPDAVAYESVVASSSREYRRKVRIMTRGLRCIANIPSTLDPRRTGFFAVQLLSHKVLMRVMGVPLLVIAATSALLARRSGFYRLALAAQALFYGLGGIGLVNASRPLSHRPVFALPAYVCLVQAASLNATWNLLVGRSYDRWEPARDDEPGGERP